MEFSLSDEQQMIRDTAAAFLAEVSDSAAVRQAMATEAGYLPETWQRLCAEMYWQAILVPEEFGGLGLGYVELAVVLEQMGARLLCAPFFSTVCLGVNALLVAGDDAQKAQYLPAIAEGSLTATLAYTGPAGRWDLDAVSATWRRDGDDYVLDGDYRYVPDGHTADLIIVAAREAGSSGAAGISLFAVPADSAGLSRSWLPTMDQTRKQASLQVQALRLPATARMGAEAQTGAALQKIIQLAQIGIAAEQMGGARAVLDQAVAYTRERVQFGRSIASFQAIKHKAADMMLKAEVSLSAVYYAACVAQEALFGAASIAAELPEAASMAKAYCSDTYFFNAGNALQMHGGVGFTWEYDVHLYFKRAKSTETFLGTGAYHRERIASLLLDGEDAA
ncbi:MAG TPA: acyl-CoA dehydrogenase family protein [Spongiibacteraceae bacterium]|nr:acyl-CoA dehydrogenase family protein [Spongiibacteraceae bacterium]